MRRKNQKKTKRLFRDTVNDVATCASFAQDEIDQWRRPTSWKIDVIDLVPKGDAFVVNLYVYLPISHDHGWNAIACKGLGHLCGRESPVYRFPSFALSVPAFLAGVAQDLRSQMPWFDAFDTPEACLTYIRTNDDETRMCPPGSRAYEECERYL